MGMPYKNPEDRKAQWKRWVSDKKESEAERKSVWARENPEKNAARVRNWRREKARAEAAAAITAMKGGES